jgi:hypothetical protein
MNIGILLTDASLGKVYRDLLSEFGDVYLFEDQNGFVTISDHFDFIILDHQICCKSWVDIYTKIPEKPTLVLATYSIAYYKAEFPETLYKNLEPIPNLKGVYFSKKEDLGTIKFFTEIESLKRTCKNLVKSLSYKSPSQG